MHLCELSEPDESQAAQALRVDVWQAEGVRIPDIELLNDRHDAHALHWGVSIGDRLVASARLCIHSVLGEAPDSALFTCADIHLPVASMNRLVVLADHRGLGISRTLDQVRINRARQLGAKTIICTPVASRGRNRALE